MIQDEPNVGGGIKVMEYLEKELPNAPSAERAILGAFIVNPDLAADTLPRLRAEEFYNPINRAILAAMREIVNAGKEIDPTLLADNLRGKGVVHDPMTIISELAYGLPSRLKLDSYIKEIKEKAGLRAYIRKANEIAARVTDGGDTLEEISQWASASFEELAGREVNSEMSFISSFADFMKREFTDGEVIAFHAGRGEIALTQSVTNRGKSTLSRNAALALATGGEFLPVVERGQPRKVLLLNFEGAAERFQRDLEVMTRDFTNSEIELVRANLFPVHAPIINGEPLSLSRHMPLFQAQVLRLKPDVIIIDTAAAAFEIRNENDNAEIQAIMKRLVHLSRKANCLTNLIHHIGKAKMEEGRTRESAHRGRGASAVGDFATSIFNLEAEANNPDRVILECAKRKNGENYGRVLTLNRATRWFTMTEGVPQRPPTSYDLVVAAVKEFNRVVKRKEINGALSGRVSEQTITRCLNEAVTRADLIKVRHGSYKFNGNAQTPTALFE